MAVLLELELALPGLTSLKDKRKVIRSLADGLAPKFGAAVAETDAQDLHQRAVLGLAFVGASPSEVRTRSERFVDALRSRPDCVVTGLRRLEAAPE